MVSQREMACWQGNVEDFRAEMDSAMHNVVETFLKGLPEKQKELLIAIANAKDAEAITSAEFIRKYKLTSASSVQAAQRVLLEKDYITNENGKYKVYDQFFRMWIVENC